MMHGGKPTGRVNEWCEPILRYLQTGKSRTNNFFTASTVSQSERHLFTGGLIPEF
jgi:hypothetical protein